MLRTKLKFYPFWENWCLISIFGPIVPKSKNPHKFTSLYFLMLNETILEMTHCQLNFDKNRLEYLPLGVGGDLELISIFGLTGPKFKKRPLIDTSWSFWGVQYLVGFLLPKRNRLWPETLFLKYKFCVKFHIFAYWAKKVKFWQFESPCWLQYLL